MKNEFKYEIASDSNFDEIIAKNQNEGWEVFQFDTLSYNEDKKYGKFMIFFVKLDINIEAVVKSIKKDVVDIGKNIKDNKD